GRTLDDAAGEAFDKFAKLVGLGFPGGAKVDREAKNGNPAAFKFPRALMTAGDLNFSFSGVKSSVARELAALGKEAVESRRADLCASYQAAIVDVLVAKLQAACEMHPEVRSVTVTGGVSANSSLRERAEKQAKDQGRILALPPLRFCTDNAAMIALAG